MSAEEDDALTESIKRARERMAGRLDRQIAENKPLLDRLAREGDCLACVDTEHGCDRHRDDRSAEEATERLAEQLADRIELEESLSSIKGYQSNRHARVALRWFRSLPADDLALLLAGRPIEERAQAAGLERARDRLMPVDHGDGEFHVESVPCWVAIPEEET